MVIEEVIEEVYAADIVSIGANQDQIWKIFRYVKKSFRCTVSVFLKSETLSVTIPGEKRWLKKFTENPPKFLKIPAEG